MSEPGFSGTGPDEPRDPGYESHAAGRQDPAEVGVPKELLGQLVGAAMVMHERMADCIPVEDIEIGSFLLGAVSYAIGQLPEEAVVILLTDAADDLAALVHAARGEDPALAATGDLRDRFTEKMAAEGHDV